jgi:hypothetical protein
MSCPPPLRALVELFNEHTPYNCVCEDSGARIEVNDLDVWFPEEQARDLLWRILGAHGVCRVSLQQSRSAPPVLQSASEDDKLRA